MSLWLKAIPAWCWALLGGLLLTGLVGGAQQLRVSGLQVALSTEKSAHSSYRTEVAERDRRAALAALAETKRRIAAVDEVDSDAKDKLDAALADAADAQSAADRLQLEVNRLRASRGATCDTIAAQQRQAGTSAVAVLADLFESADRRAGELAAALDRSRVAGFACEAAYDALRLTQ